MASIAMKKFKIPTSMDPFVVEVNGWKYEYPAGTEQEVPEEVAAVIENIEGNTPKPDPRAGEPSFESLRDKPFGEETAVIFDQTVVFEVELDVGWQMEQALPISVGDHVKITFDGTVYESEAIDGDRYLPGGVMFGNLAGFGGEANGAPFVAGTSAGLGITMFMGEPGTHAIKIEKTEIHKLDPKFLPGGAGGVVLYPDEHGFLYRDKVLSEENQLSRNDLLEYARRCTPVVINTGYDQNYPDSEYEHYTYVNSIYTTDDYASVYVGDGRYFYSKEKPYESGGGPI